MIFRWLYIRRMRSLFGQYMQPGVFDKNIIPKLHVTEKEALWSLISSYFPSVLIRRSDPRDLIVLKNQISRILANTATPSDSPVKYDARADVWGENMNDNPISILSIPDIEVLSSRDAGTGWQYTLKLGKDRGIDGIVSLLRSLQPGHQVIFETIGAEEAYHAARASGTALEIKTFHHGTSGTWRQACFEEAVEHLRQCLPTNEAQWQHCRDIYYWFPK